MGRADLSGAGKAAGPRTGSHSPVLDASRSRQTAHALSRSSECSSGPARLPELSAERSERPCRRLAASPAAIRCSTRALRVSSGALSLVREGHSQDASSGRFMPCFKEGRSKGQEAARASRALLKEPELHFLDDPVE